MPKFRSLEKQAERMVAARQKFGEARHEHKNTGRLHSKGTTRTWRDTLRLVTHWMQQRGCQELRQLTLQLANEYLSERATHVAENTLSREHLVLKQLLRIELVRVHAEWKPFEGRAYTRAQVELLVQRQTPAHAFSTRLAYHAGLRAHELLTIRRVKELPPSVHRDWRPERFQGRDGVRYVVTGKGGLRREVLIPRELAAQLEARRLETPRIVSDREIQYVQRYDLKGGRLWSSSFSKASRYALGWSTGGHGLRHSYAQERVEELQQRGYGLHDAKAIVSQELGHFRVDVVNVYLR